jgi:hypothetical protein
MKEITMQQAQQISGAASESNIAYNAAWIAVGAFSAAVVGQLIHNGPNYDLPIGITEATMLVAMMTVAIVGGKDISTTKPF